MAAGFGFCGCFLQRGENDEMKLLEPIIIRNKRIRNRIVMAPMEARMNTIDGDVTREMIDYYAERAKGGTGMVIVENTFIDEFASRSSFCSSGLYSDHLISGKNLLAEAIRLEGATAILQLSHGGRQASKGATKYEPIAPSEVFCISTNRKPRELSINEIIEIEDAFAEAARRAEQAGFDGVEIHGAHGYLICSFLSPLTNLRTDEYGGSLENRAQFAKNIIKKIRSQVSDSFIVGYRISACEFIEGGLEIDEACRFAAGIQKDIDYIHVSAGIYDSPSFWMSSPSYVPRGKLLPLARQMKNTVNIPVITVGSLNPQLAEQALLDGDADLAAFGRALIADPFLAKKLYENRPEDIRPCCRGNEGCVSRFNTACAMRCEVNPACGREAKYKPEKVRNPKKLLVIGGGVSGMEAARMAALLGHDVTLIEKESVLGGNLVQITQSAFKASMADFLKWLAGQLQKSGVKIKLNALGTRDLIIKENPDALIIAIGSMPVSTSIKGAENACGMEKALKNPETLGEKVVVIGGGLAGAETALSLAARGHKVTILEMTDKIADKLEPASREALLQSLIQNGVCIETETKVLEIGNGFAEVQKDGKEKRILADTVVLAAGFISHETGELLNIVENTICIGDCIEARKIYHCMHEAWHAVFNKI